MKNYKKILKNKRQIKEERNGDGKIQYKRVGSELCSHLKIRTFMIRQWKLDNKLDEDT